MRQSSISSALTTDPRQRSGSTWSSKTLLAYLVLAFGSGALETVLVQAADAPLAINSHEVELHYRLNGGNQDAAVELWYTRDRGASWQRGASQKRGQGPVIFSAPAEGLYGFILTVQGAGAISNPPTAFQSPQRWVFVDYTPPLVQWDGVDLEEKRADARAAHLRWTAYDDNFASRPIALAWQADGDSKWHGIETALPNLGRYDWQIPREVAGSIRLKITARDQGEQVVERIHGPIAVASVAAATQPVQVVADRRPAAETQPATASRPTAAVTPANRHHAEELARQGAWHLERGQNALAAERFREALEANPEALSAASQLASVYRLQKDYGKATELYRQVLARNSGDVAALRGLALVHAAQKEYVQSRDALQQLLQSNRNDAEGWLDLGDVLFMMGQQGEARRHWQRALQVDPEARAVMEKARRRMELYGTGSSEGAPRAGQ